MRGLIGALFLCGLGWAGWNLYEFGKVPGLDQLPSLAKMAAPETPAPDSAPAAASWIRQPLAGISFEAPVQLVSMPANTTQFPPAVAQQIQVMQVWTGETRDGFAVALTYLQSNGIHTLSLEGAIQGEMRSLAAQFGNGIPQFQKTTVAVDGFTGFRTAMQCSRNGRVMNFVGVTVQNGSKMWAVVTGSQTATHSADAERVLASIRMPRY